MKAFDEVFEDKTKYGTKIKTSEYRNSGLHVIIDQGQKLVAGYTNLKEGLFEDVPVIIFGDHTRVVKYVDKPFFLGADGVKILKSKIENANHKYLYYALVNAKIPDTGYNRHFKWLKEVRINYPDLAEQQKIVDILDKVERIISAERQQLEELDMLTKSRFLEIFGDPVMNPKGWLKKPFLDMGECKNGMNFHQDDTGIEIHCLGVGDFKDFTLIDDVEKLPMVSLNEMPSEEYLLKDGDIVFVRSNGNKALVGRSLAVYPQNVPTTFSGFCIRYRKTDYAILIPYLLRVLKTESMRQKMIGRGANIQNLNQQILRALEIPVPPIELQNQFSAFVHQVDKIKTVEQKRLEKLQLLFNSLMQKYFG